MKFIPLVVLLFLGANSFSQDNPPFGTGDSCQYYIPNVFTEGCGSVFLDGLGDSFWEDFRPISTCPMDSNYVFTIYNRWGEVVFESKDPERGWRGYYKDTDEVVSDGVYVYSIEFIDVHGEEKKIRGHVTYIK